MSRPKRQAAENTKETIKLFFSSAYNERSPRPRPSLAQARSLPNLEKLGQKRPSSNRPTGPSAEKSARLGQDSKNFVSARLGAPGNSSSDDESMPLLSQEKTTNQFLRTAASSASSTHSTSVSKSGRRRTNAKRRCFCCSDQGTSSGASATNPAACGDSQLTSPNHILFAAQTSAPPVSMAQADVLGRSLLAASTPTFLLGTFQPLNFQYGPPAAQLFPFMSLSPNSQPSPRSARSQQQVQPLFGRDSAEKPVFYTQTKTAVPSHSGNPGLITVESKTHDRLLKTVSNSRSNTGGNEQAIRRASSSPVSVDGHDDNDEQLEPLDLSIRHRPKLEVEPVEAGRCSATANIVASSSTPALTGSANADFNLNNGVADVGSWKADTLVKQEPKVPRGNRRINRAKRRRQTGASSVPRLLPAVAVPWTALGQPVMARVLSSKPTGLSPRPVKCYSAIRHTSGEIVRHRDCVLVSNGAEPFVGKIYQIWLDEQRHQIMLNVVWYYHFSQTQLGPDEWPRGAGKCLGQRELLASRHTDVVSCACIEDKAWVLPDNLYRRYLSEIKRSELGRRRPCAFMRTNTTETQPTEPGLLPYEMDERYSYRLKALPPFEGICPDNLFLCRYYFDVRTRKVIRNPSMIIDK